MAFDAEGFGRSVALPPELKISHIREAIEHVETRVAELIDIYFEQANVFSGIVGIMGVQALHALSPYKKHKHPDVAQQRFPDLSLRGRLGPPPEQALESKGSTRPWALQSHYNHPGWYIVWRYAVDQTRRLKPGKLVAIWRSIFPFLPKRIGSTRAAKPLRDGVAALTLSESRTRRRDSKTQSSTRVPG
jgi:hypothetical protein